MHLGVVRALSDGDQMFPLVLCGHGIDLVKFLARIQL
jgi:hypothetical protein